MPEPETSDNALCLEFANTWGDRNDANSDKLHSYEDLLIWAGAVGIVSDREHRDLKKFAGRNAAGSSTAFRAALELRDTVFGLFSAAAAGKGPPERNVADLNEALESLPRRRLRCAEDSCEWEWPVEETDPRRILWPVIRSAAELVTSPEGARIRECGAPDCNWLFLDNSRGGRRRWCDMATCGNRAKARRYYERHRRNI